MSDEWLQLIEKIEVIGYCNEKIAKVMKETNREDFLPKEVKKFAFFDQPLPIGEGQTTSQPSLIAYILTKLDLKEGMNVMEVGGGCGFVSALISKLVGEGKVTTIERNKKLYEMMKKNLKNYRNVELVCKDGTKGYEKNAPYDRILVSAAAKEMPEALFQQLKEGGRMILPLGGLLFQELVQIDKKNGKPDLNHLLPVLFVPLVEE